MSSNWTSLVTGTRETVYPVKLVSRDAHRAALVCEEAFRDAALTRYLFPSAQPSSGGVITVFEFFVRYATLYGEMYAPTSAIEGVACWYREDGPNPSFWRLIRVGGLVALLRERDAWSRLIALEPYLSQIRKTWMRGPYLFLDLLAIAPSLQGRGFGATLLRHFVGRADANRLPCCVETFNRSNVPMYRHFGFEVAEEAQETPVGEALYFMTREPQLA